MTPDELRKQAKKEFLHELSRQLHKYTISLVLDGKFYGTGTLVEVDGVKGVLTAEHIVHNPEGTRFNNLENSRQRLDIPVTLFDEKFPEDLPEPEIAKFEVRRLDWYPEYRSDKNFGEWGPDLAFIKLDEGLPQAGSLKAKKSFLNLTKDIAKRTNINRGRHDFFGFVGAPDKWMKQRKKSPEESPINLLNSAAFFGPDYAYHPNAGGFDFLDILCGPDAKIPGDFSGVSGGGLWFIRVPKDADPPDIPEHDFRLIGVAFLQVENPGQPTMIRAHGPNSIYKKFLGELRQNFLRA
jgi:hypothetical protein